MKIRRKPSRAIEVPVAALSDPMALVTALSAARLAAGLRLAYWDHEQVDRQIITADTPHESARPQATPPNGSPPHSHDTARWVALAAPSGRFRCWQGPSASAVMSVQPSPPSPATRG